MAVATLASTARWIAAVRAQESRRDDRLFHDPWAATLAGAEGHAWLAERANSPSLQTIAIRVRFFDEFVERATADSGVRQVVLLAAGLDTRAFRLPWPAGTRVFELDRPDVLGEKEGVLRAAAARPACERRLIGADLAASWSDLLIESGFHRGRPACWLLEGILFYLPTATTLAILDQLTAMSATGSLLAFDIPNGITLRHPWTRAWVEMQETLGVPFVGTMDDPSAVLTSRNWAPTQIQVGDRDANYGRWPYPPIALDVPAVPRHWLVTAEKEGHR